MSRAVVELHDEHGLGERPGVVALLRAMHDRCSVRAFDPQRPAALARLVTSTRAAAAPHLLQDPRVPVAVILAPGETPSREVSAHAAALVVESARRADELGSRAVAVADDAIDRADHPPLSPFNRAKRRALLGLPADLVVCVGRPGTGNDLISSRAVPTALALAGSAVVSGPWFVTALALGTPTVTDHRTMERFGARDGVDTLVASPGEAEATARSLAEDETAAARIGRAAVRLFEASFDARRSAERLLALLEAPGSAPERTIRIRLDELTTPVLDERSQRVMARCLELSSTAR